MGRTGAINAKVHATKSHRNYSLRNARETHHGTLNSCFVAFRNVWCIWDRFVTALKSMQTGQSDAINAKRSCHELTSHLFTTNAPDTNKGTLNSCFVAFRKVWVHLGSFRYCTKLGAKWAELVQ